MRLVNTTRASDGKPELLWYQNLDPCLQIVHLYFFLQRLSVVGNEHCAADTWVSRSRCHKPTTQCFCSRLSIQLFIFLFLIDPLFSGFCSETKRFHISHHSVTSQWRTTWRTWWQGGVAEVLACEKPCIYPFKLNERLAVPRVRAASLQQERRWEMTYNKAGLIVCKQEEKMLRCIFSSSRCCGVTVIVCGQRESGALSFLTGNRDKHKHMLEGCLP